MGMATPLKSANTIDFNQARNDQAEATPEEGSYSQLRYRMVSLLQNSLDLRELLQLFCEELGKSVGSDGMRYSHNERRVQHLIGRQATHSCGYRLITRQDHLGEIVFYNNSRFSDEDLRTIETLLSTIICPLRNALQYEEALSASLTDPLTGAGNRVSLSNTLQREISLAHRHKLPLSLLILDIDKFKAINDQHGHSAGDKVLQQLVITLGELSRNTDACFRFGGEEFVVVLNRTSAGGAMIIAERIRQRIEAMEIPWGDAIVRLSVSIGATTYCKDDTADSLFNRADKALYDIKKSGGNRVVSL
jgi:diguanylate cyclase (GGDEF)-like protein